MTTPRTAFLAAPALMGAYGLIRIADGLDGDHGPGVAWTAGHLCFLAGLAFFVQGFAAMRTMAGRNRLSTAGFWTATAGAVTLGGQFLIDIAVGFASADRAEMQELFARIQDTPGMLPVFYDFGPLLFFVAQLVLAVQLASRRILKPWAPVLMLAGTALPLVDKDLIPVTAVLLLISFAPLYRGRPSPRPETASA
ncbi:hypothetical protein ACFWBN_12445 [Streptomyces sp. NPDC059989]|uniref:hypothetical protein n=1 Tax=Streptomyces sp. NPDC059989 TaxID=3347026 RepID=UPI0036C3ED76